MLRLAVIVMLAAETAQAADLHEQFAFRHESGLAAVVGHNFPHWPASAPTMVQVVKEMSNAAQQPHTSGVQGRERPPAGNRPSEAKPGSRGRTARR